MSDSLSVPLSTSRTLQRVAVRMLHDPEFVTSVYSDPAAALADLALGPREWSWLTRSAPATWLTDPDRPSRVFEALRTEFPVACALAEVAGARREEMLRFFASPDFHQAVQERRVLALSFGRWMIAQAKSGRLGKKPTAALAELELACAELRREPPRGRPPAGASDRLVLAPRVRLLRLPLGSLSLLEATRKSLQEGNSLRRSRLAGRQWEWVLVELQGEQGALQLGAVPAELAELLLAASTETSQTELLKRAVDLGASPEEAPDVVQSIVEDGLLVPA
jgi:hypothetical protein